MRGEKKFQAGLSWYCLPRDSRQSIVAAQTRGGKGPPMSALGQKQTCAVQDRMSALPPKADITGGFQILRMVRAMRGVTPALSACRRPPVFPSTRLVPIQFAIDISLWHCGDVGPERGKIRRIHPPFRRRGFRRARCCHHIAALDRPRTGGRNDQSQTPDDALGAASPDTRAYGAQIEMVHRAGRRNRASAGSSFDG
jgi:hypothetical protein